MRTNATKYGITSDFRGGWNVVEYDKHGMTSVIHEESITIDEANRIVKRLRRENEGNK